MQKDNSPFVVSCAIRILFSAVGPTTPGVEQPTRVLSDSKAAYSVESPNTVDGSSPSTLKLGGTAGAPANGTSPSCSVSGRPASGSAFTRSPAGISALPPSLLPPPTMEPSVSSVLRMPNFELLALPRDNQESSGTVFSSRALLLTSCP